MNDAEAGLPAVRAALEDAVHALVGRTTDHITRGDGTTELVFGASIYVQLVERRAGAQGTRNGSHARSMPPVVLDVIDLLAEIDATVPSWLPREAARPARWVGPESTINRLWALADAPWRPQDVPTLRTITPVIEAWTTKALALIDPPRRWTIPAPCPACGATTVYRPDSAGEVVRQPALQVTEHGCQCQHCKHLWEPQLFAHLARTLGTLPDNVLR
ncbi:hypothetical protein MYK68_14045 [Gordonia sp. PP30]|uniref:DUF7341 domain-containing protein n=1 Tax=Gordonia sp. PP30 TaxID=2935861 RepID=UPI001FFF6176|nr:hypothetical protein [Gordonia sp. PP30]UQE73852.1 hypothetical protein MYK68_14045 [Gordonia sp. PP30]